MNVTRCCVFMLFLVWLPVATLLAAEPLRYGFQNDQQFGYTVEITAELPTAIETLSGRILYRTKSAAEPLKVTYQGGLTKSSKDKPGYSARQPGFGPFGPRIAPPPSPFARNTNPFKGLETTTNEIALTPRGEILTLEGSSQLPYLLGNLSLLAFEPLPEVDQPSWTVDGGVAIKEGSDQSRDRFGPIFDPFGRPGGDKPEKITTAGQSISFRLENKRGSLATYRKTYRLHSPGDATRLTVEGTGTWTFNRELGISEALDFNQKLSVEEGNATVTISVAIKYRRLTAEDLAKVEQERLEAERKRQEQHARHLAEQAEMKRQAEAPLEADTKRELLEQLASGDASRVVMGLGELAKKSPQDPDPEIAAAIEPLLKHENKALQDAAEKALVKWSPEFKLKSEINNAYKGPRPVTEPGRPVPAGAPLFIGQIVAIKWGGSWYPGEVKDLLPDGQLKVAYRGWGSRTETVSRSGTQLAPDEVDQPNLAPSELAVLRGDTRVATRTWTDSTGTYKIEAEFLRLDNDQVVLKRKQDGREISVALAKLGAADQKAAQELAKEQNTAPANPFEP